MNSHTKPTPESARDAARRYLAEGFAPIPLPAKSKKPAIDEWPRLRVSEVEVDARFPAGANLGLLTGAASNGLIDIDLDCPEAVRAAPVLLPRTSMISGRASSVRSHWWYRVDEPPRRASEAFDDPTLGGSDVRRRLVELRSTGGQTMVPPSVHPTGERCVWHESGEPAGVRIAALRGAVGAVAAAALLARHWPAGARHDAALSLVGGLLRAGWEVERVARFLHAVCAAADDCEVSDRLATVRDTAAKIAEGKNVTGWPRLEKLLGDFGVPIVRSVREWLGVRRNPGDDGRQPSPRPHGASAKPVTPIPPYVPFPTRLLPPVVCAYVEATASAMNCDPSYSALPALAALGAAIGGSHVASPKKRWKEPPHIWALPIGRSGATKSPPYRDVEDLAEDINDRLEAEYRVAVAVYEAELEEWEAAKKEAKKGGRELGPKPSPPAKKAFLKGDVTIEALVGALQDNPHGLLIGQDELSAWIGSFVKYAGKTGATDLPRWLQLHHAGTVNYTRKTGDPERREVRVRGVGVSVTGTIQPKVLSRVLTEEFRASGFLARLLLSMPPWRKRQWTEAEIDEPTRQAFAELLDTLYRLPPGAWPDGRPAPHLVKLSVEAKAMFVAFYDANGAALETADEDMSAIMSKLEGYALRFALIFHCCRLKEYAKDAPVTAGDMDAAINLTRWFRDEAERVYLELGEPAEVQSARHLAEVVRKLAHKSGGRVTPRDLQRFNCRKYRTSATAEVVLEELVGMGLGRWEVAAGPKGGPATRGYVPCMTHDATDATEAENSGGEDDGGGGVHDSTPDGRFPPSGASPSSDDGSSAPACDYEVAVEPADGVVSDASCVMHDEGHVEETPELPRSGPEASGMHDGVVSCRPFVSITSANGLPRVAQAVRASARVGLDIETTGLSHARDRARLLSLATSSDTFLVDLFQVDPGPLWPALAGVEVVGQNLGFDLPFLMRLGFVPGRVADTMLASQVLDASDYTVGHSLKDLAHRHLGVNLDKEMQTADWSGPLSEAHLAYAARDAELPLLLWEKLGEELARVRLTEVADIEMAALPTIAWAATKGVGFDRATWEKLAAENETRGHSLRDRLDAAAPNPGNLFGVTNWNSPEEVKVAFRALGVNLESTDDDALAALNHAAAELLREYRAATKLSGTYGREWLRHVASDGRVYATWRQIGAGASGRMSCKEPNLQQLPRDRLFRRCFVAPPGRVLVKADYSQIELRIAAKITGDRRMLDAYRNNEDLHTLTARALLRKTDVTKADRQLAKAVNFGLLYGQGARGLARYARSNYGVALTEAEAARHRETFFRTYPGLRAWHRSMPDSPIETRTLAGRRRVGVTAFTEKLNTPVQGTGADGLKRALGLLWERRAACPAGCPVLLVHDEIVVECDEARREETASWVRDAMRDGMAPLVDPVPVEVEVTVSPTWGG